MDQKPLVKRRIANFGISLDVLSFCVLEDFFSVFQKNWVFGYSWSTRKPRFPMDQRPLVKGCIANFVIFLDIFEFLRFGRFFSVFQKVWIQGCSWCNKTWQKPGFPMDQRPLVKGCISNCVIFLDVSEVLRFYCFSKKSYFWIFLVHPMASVLLSPSVERCFVSRMRDCLGTGPY